MNPDPTKLDDAAKAIMREFDLTSPVVGVQNNHAILWDVDTRHNEGQNRDDMKWSSVPEHSPFSHMDLRRIWAHYRGTHDFGEKYAKYKKADLLDLSESMLKWYCDNNLDAIFNNFLLLDGGNGPLYLVFCLESGDEILIRRVFAQPHAIESPQEPPSADRRCEDKSFFQIIDCQYSRLAGTFKRNQLGPIRIQRNIPGEMISIFASK